MKPNKNTLSTSVGFRELNPTYKSIKLDVGWVEQSETQQKHTLNSEVSRV
ncbi:MAG: hypothetical protein O4859_15010 [Trichodesmium sp. St18_bin1]|nr:hypothetical protein [Trichodesmium sp. St18_bin1]